MITRSLERFEKLYRYQFAGTPRKPAPRRTSNVGSNEMAACEYKYSGKTWKPRPSHSDGNCFFHALFGEKTELDGSVFYFDKHTAFRRLYWAAFLVFFQQVEMPEALLEIIQKCFVASDSFVNKSPGNPEDFNDYIRNIALGQYWVLVEEIPIVSTLWNVRVVLFLGEQDVPQIFEPNPQIYGTFPFASITPLREQVIRLTEHHFERLSVVVEPNTHIVGHIEPEISYYEEESDEELEDSVYKHRKHYKKGGSAGVQGSLYQINLITLILLNALKKCKTWLLSTENKAAGKFDDLILESPEGDLLIQAKHKEGKNKIINYDALLSTTPSPFSLAKYFVSFQQIRTKFKIRNVVICTNADLQTGKSMEGLVEPHEVTKYSVLHFEDASNTFYTFNDGMVDKLRESVTKYFAQNMPSNKVCVTDEGIKEFLAYLQFFPNYMNEERLDDIVNMLIRSLSLTRDLDSTDTFKDIHSVILEWFKNVNGQYLSKLDAKAILCDIRTTRYCQSFETYDISFKNDPPQGLKRILHVIPSGALILSVIKLYQVLQEKEKGKVLFLDPNDSLSIQKQVVDCFTHPRYTFLVITSPAWADDEVTHKISKKIVKILDSRKYKKLVLIAEAENKLARCMKSLNLDDYEEIKEEIRFQDLTEQAQTTLKTKKNIVFQGTVMTLEELVAEDLDCFIDSDILEKLAKNTAIEIGSKPVHADENINNYYIYRTLKRNDKDVPEEKFRLLKDFPERIVLISDSAGMGKSTILTNLAVKIKENYPSLWVIRIDLNNQSTAFRDAAKKRLKSISVVDLLNVHKATKLKGDFARKLFLKPDNVVLMLDAVDEVSSAYMELVMGMMVEAKLERNFAKIFVTTRPHLCEMLQHTLEVAAFTLEPFSKEDQVDFLTKYWTQRLDLKGVEERKRCQQYAEALINEMSRWIDEGAENTFAGIPLQTRMLAEVFQERNQLEEGEPKQWEECKEFLSSGKDEPQLPKKINLIQLYELFVAKKRDIFVDIKGNTGGNPISEEALKDKFEECHEFHRNLALRIMFYFHECEIFGSYKDWAEFMRAFVDNYVLRAGIVQEVDRKVNFIHRTFAEYFAAECLVLDLRKGLFTKKFQEFLLEEVLIREEFFVVRAFFDSFVQKELPFIPDNTLTAFSESDYLSVLVHRRKSYLHLLAQEGSIGTMEFFFACSNSRMTEDETLEEVKGTFVDATDMELNTPLHVACSRGHLNVVTTLVERGANVNFQNVNEETPLHLAALGGHLDIVEYLVDKAGADLNKVNSYGESALLLAARKGNLKIIKFLVKRGMKYTGIYTTALHIASSEGNLTIVKYLVERVQADVDILDVDNCAPLHDASHEGHLNVVEYLVRCGSNVNATNRDLNTAFHAAALKGYVYLVTFFIENGADTAIANRDGYTIVHLIEWLRSQISESDTESNDSREGSDVEEEIKDNKAQSNDGNGNETSKNDNEEGECVARNGNDENDIVESIKKDGDK